jgi:glycosyltransferase involved in cell wall biosynthesis
VQPVVSVVVPLFNQGHYLREALDSVVAASHDPEVPVEVIVVDDHSTDDSRSVAEALLDERPWMPATLVARAANGGLPVARNTGFARARGRYVFALDADNLLYPGGLCALARHLDSAPDDVVAAYGLLERFDETGALGLTSHLPWDPDLLVHGAFIDAMAMFRRDAWLELGGYTDHDGIFGWEDYDLWLTVAERGRRASLVTAVVGRYREQAGSMRKVSDVDMASNFVLLRERHPRLPWPS